MKKCFSVNLEVSNKDLEKVLLRLVPKYAQDTLRFPTPASEDGHQSRMDEYPMGSELFPEIGQMFSAAVTEKHVGQPPVQGWAYLLEDPEVREALALVNKRLNAIGQTGRRF